MNQPIKRPVGPLTDEAYAKMLGVTPEMLKKRAEEAAKKDMNYKEYNALRYLAAVISALPLVQEQMQNRCRKSGKRLWGMLRSATGLLCKVFDALVKTVPGDKLPQLKKELVNTHLNVNTEYSERDQYERENYVCMRESTAILICKKAMQNECYLCMKTREEAKRCEMFRLINESLMFTPPKPDTDNCVYAEGNLNAVEARSADELLGMQIEEEEQG